MVRQSITFCQSFDGARIAIAASGQGPPLLRAAHWLSHVEHDAESPVWRPWLETLSARWRYIRHDQRGCGLSDAGSAGFSLEASVADLEAVADHLRLERFALLGMSQGGAAAITYAARHPQRVTHLVLVGAYARGALRRAESAEETLEAQTLVNLVRLGWGRDNPAFRQVFTNQFIPAGTPVQHQWWNELERLTASPENAARILESFHAIDVSAVARELRLPVLVMHSRGDARVPFEEGRRLAALIPDAQFVPLDSDNHVLLEAEPAWGRFLAELRGFLQQDVPAQAPALTAAEREVLRLLAQGLDNKSLAGRLGKSEKTVRNQLSSIFAKLGVRTRAEAIVRVHGGPLA